MSVHTLVKSGILTNINIPVTIVDVDAKVGVVHYNPGLARDSNGRIMIAVRSCITDYKKWHGITHPIGYENFLHLGILDEDTLKISGLKLIKPLEEYEGFQWGIEDIRLYYREDGLHGVGVIIPIDEGKNYKLRQAEILIDYEAGTYKLLQDLGRPFGHAEKNWSPSEHANDQFDFIYSPTQIVKNGEVIGEDNDLFLHNGTPLIELPNNEGYISLGHSVIAVLGERTYAQIALKFDYSGKLVEHSQFFHFNVGWREALQETIEFASGLLWSKDKVGEELLAGLGIKDELLGICKIPMSKLKFEPYADSTWYAWQYQGEPNRVEI